MGVYAQPANLDNAYLESVNSLFSLSTTEKGDYSIEELLQPVLEEIHIGRTKGYYIYHAGLKQYVRIRLQLCFVLADMMERNDLMNVDAPTGHFGCGKCTQKTQLFYMTEEEVQNQEHAGHKRTMEELLRLIQDPPKKDTSEARKGYKLNRPLWLTITDFNIFSAMQTDLLHAELYGSGNFIRHFNQILHNLGPHARTILGQRISNATGL
jgi:hypothetical protein